MATNRVRAVLVGLGGLALAWLPGCGAHAHSATAAAPGEDAQAPVEDAGVQVPHDAGLVPADTGTLVEDAEAPGACATGADLVYVASEERNLYSFDPTTAAFTLLGNIDCAQGIYVNSMAIDRNATAWINYGDGSLWEVSTKTGVCMSTGFVPNQGGVGLFGMGFAAKVAGGNAETLFIDDLNGGGLGFIDLSTMTLERFGPFTGDLAGRSAELAGTGDARLFGFFAGSPLGDAGSASVTQIDPDSEGPLTQYPLPSVDTGSDWAFSFYGGDFYLYTADKYDENDPDTVVTRFRPSDGSVTVIDPQLGFRIVGAGSSTCVPTTATQ
jgi:hypothetical protein